VPTHTGIYTLVVDPGLCGDRWRPGNHPYTGSVKVQLSTPIVLKSEGDGSATAFSSTVAGRYVSMEFTSSAPQWVTVDATAQAAEGPFRGDVSVLGADGKTAIKRFDSWGRSTGIVHLPQAGTYYLQVRPGRGEVISGTMSAKAALTGPITVDGPALQPATTSPGQQVRYSFDAVADQPLTLSLSDIVLKDVPWPPAQLSFAIISDRDDPNRVPTVCRATSEAQDSLTFTPSTTGGHVLIIEPGICDGNNYVDPYRFSATVKLSHAN
jgi:hypothetical protein